MVGSNSPMRPIGLAALSLVASCTSALALSCTFSIDDVDFGTIDLASGLSYATIGNLHVNCAGTPNKQVQICPNIGSGSGGVGTGGDPRYMTNGTDRLQFNIYQNAAFSKIWGSHFWGLAPKPPQLKRKLDRQGNLAFSEPVRIYVRGGQSAMPPGRYVSSFAGGHTLVSYAYSTQGSCSAIGASNGVQVPFTVSATNVGSCSVASTALDFGATTILNGNVDTTANVFVACTQGIPYALGLGNGNNGNAPTARAMSNGTAAVRYGIYKNPARTMPWGANQGTDTVQGTGSGTIQNHTAYGRVPAQSTPVPGTYRDTVVVTVTY